MSPRYLFRESQLLAQDPHLVFEQLPEGLDQLQLHHLRKPAHVVMALYDCRRALERYTFYHVRVERPLGEKLGVLYLFRLVLEYGYEFIADDLPFPLRLCHTSELFEEPLFRIDMDQPDMEVVLKGLPDLLRLSL